MEKKTYSYSYDEEHYNGAFDCIDDAMAAAMSSNECPSAIWIGENVPPPPPETFWQAYDWIDCVVGQDEYSGDWAAGWPRKTLPHRRELEDEVRAVMAKWLDKYGLRPTFYNVENAKQYVVGDSK